VGDASQTHDREATVWRDDPNLIADFIRIGVIGGDLWLAALLCRILWLRRDQPSSSARANVSNLTTLAFLGFLLLNMADRAEHIGNGISPVLLASAACVLLGIIGVMRRVKIDWRAPTRRDDEPHWKQHQQKH
jgi:hypothetical protein